MRDIKAELREAFDAARAGDPAAKARFVALLKEAGNTAFVSIEEPVNGQTNG